MGKHEKLVLKILKGNSDNNIDLMTCVTFCDIGVLMRGLVAAIIFSGKKELKKKLIFRVMVTRQRLTRSNRYETSY